MIESLRQKLTKNENGADIPDKNQFIKNLGLLEIVKLAKNAAPASRKINGKNLTQDVQLTAADVNAATQEMLRVEIPVGVPLPWPTESAPTGWFICNGQPFDKKKHPLLALAYPSGNLPDLRGEFIRGWDDGRKVDTGRVLLSAQAAYTPPIPANGWGTDGASPSPNHAIPSGRLVVGSGSIEYSEVLESLYGAGNDMAVSGDIRPRNIAFNYIVRAA